MSNAMTVHPTDLALVPAARLAARGTNPMLVLPENNTLNKIDAGWLDRTPTYGPNGEDGVSEPQVERLLFRVARPGSGGIPP